MELAINCYAEVIEGMHKQVRKYPERVAYHELLSMAAVNLGNLSYQVKNLVQAETAFQNAWTICNEMTQRFPKRKIFWQLKGTAANGLALVLCKKGNLASSNDMYESSIEAWLILGENFEPSTKQLIGHAVALHGFSKVKQKQGFLNESVQLLTKSRNLKRTLVEHVPHSAAHRKSLSLGIGNLANAEAANGDFEKAAEYFEDSIEIALELLESHPNYPGQLSNINYQFVGLIKVNTLLGRHQQAETTIQRMGALLPDNVAQIQRTIQSLNEIAKSMAATTALDNDAKQQVSYSFSEQASKLADRGKELSSGFDQWIKSTSLESLNLEAKPMTTGD